MQQKVMKSADLDKEEKINIISTNEECQEALVEFIQEEQDEQIKTLENEASALSLKNLKKLEDHKKFKDWDKENQGSDNDFSS